MRTLKPLCSEIVLILLCTVHVKRTTFLRVGKSLDPKIALKIVVLILHIHNLHEKLPFYETVVSHIFDFVDNCFMIDFGRNLKF